MALFVDNVKRNPKTGKVEKTGTRSEIGNVSRGAAGGYAKGPITGLSPTGQTDIRGQPVYGGSVPQGIVPNSLPSPVLQNTPDRGAGALPNSPFVNGYNPAMPQQPIAAPLPPSPAAPVVLPTSSSTPSAGAQEALVQPNQAQLPPGAAFIQGGEPTLPPGTETGGVSAITASDVLVLQGLGGLAKSVTTGLASLAKAGAMASLPGGMEVLAVQAAGPVASGVVKEGAAAAGQVAVNTATTTQLATVAQKLGFATISLGALAGAIKSSTGSRKAYGTDVVELSKQTGELINKLQRSRNPELVEQARQLYEQQKIIEGDFNTFLSYVPLGVGGILNSGDIKAVRDAVAESTVAYENFVQDEAGKALLSQIGSNPSQDDIDAAKTFMNSLPTGPLKTELQKLLNEGQAAADERAALEASESERLKQEFQRQQTEDQQAFQTAEREARQAYEQSVRDAANSQKQFEEDTATTTSEGGTLTFGLLGGNGSTEFVSADKASQAYFSKNYAELTPAQKQLLNLLKGGN